MGASSTWIKGVISRAGPGPNEKYGKRTQLAPTAAEMRRR
jgi:uncharacterized protein (DUF39 family)